MNAPFLPMPGLTESQRKKRHGRLTASRVGVLMGGNKKKIWGAFCELYEEVWGLPFDPDYQREDLSKVWAIRRGIATEPANLGWYELKTGRTLDYFDVVQHPEVEWAAATPDGVDKEIGRVVECKDVGGREPLATVHARYTPQVYWQIDCCRHLGVTGGVFSIIEGGNEPKIDLVDYDPEYGAELWRRAREFWHCIEMGRAPFDKNEAVPSDPLADFVNAPVVAPPPMKEYDMDGSNQWADHAATWLENVEAASKADAAESEIKKMMPKDAKRAFGYGVEIIRNRANRLSLKALEG